MVTLNLLAFDLASRVPLRFSLTLACGLSSIKSKSVFITSYCLYFSLTLFRIALAATSFWAKQQVVIKDRIVNMIVFFICCLGFLNPGRHFTQNARYFIG